jgi:hypothetical protein
MAERGQLIEHGLAVICVQKVPLRKVYEINALLRGHRPIALILLINQLLCSFRERTGLLRAR